jgi:hypothetical protein
VACVTPLIVHYRDRTHDSRCKKHCSCSPSDRIVVSTVIVYCVAVSTPATIPAEGLSTALHNVCSLDNWMTRLDGNRRSFSDTCRGQRRSPVDYTICLVVAVLACLFSAARANSKGSRAPADAPSSLNNTSQLPQTGSAYGGAHQASCSMASSGILTQRLRRRG